MVTLLRIEREHAQRKTEEILQAYPYEQLDLKEDDIGEHGQRPEVYNCDGAHQLILVQAQLFHLDAMITTGQLTAPDFPSLRVRHSGTGAKIHSDVGTANHPGAEVAMKVDTGSNSLHQGEQVGISCGLPLD